jgi:hypothetical protein
MSTSRILAVTAAVAFAGALTAHAQQVSEKANRDRKLLTTEEIDAAHVNNAYQVVEKLHPEWLRRVTRIQTLGGGRPQAPTNRGAPGENDGGGAGASSASSGDNYIQPNQETRQMAVFVDGTDMGGLEELAQIQSNLVEEMRFLTSSDAEAKYGPRYPSGAIEVRLKSR